MIYQQSIQKWKEQQKIVKDGEIQGNAIKLLPSGILNEWVYENNESQQSKYTEKSGNL